MKPLNIGLLGLGVVAGGTTQILARNADEISRRTHRQMRIHSIATRTPSKRDAYPHLSNTPVSNDCFGLVDDPEIDVVVELMGGTTLAKELVLRAIANGKHVVTANKALIAEHGNEIFALAMKQNVMMAFEAAVAGGIPIIKSIREGLSANRIHSVVGIINGTSNYILSEMHANGGDFASILDEAKRLGYAEVDPTFDIGGHDAAHKLTILSSIAFGVPLSYESTYCEGIEHITPEDLMYAQELGYQVKHLGIARRTENHIEQRVHLTLLPKQRLIAHVNGVMNAVMLKSDAVGETLHYGAGAGGEATGSAVVADLIDIARALETPQSDRVPSLGFYGDALHSTPVLAMEEVVTAYYLRIPVKDEPGVLSKLTHILAQKDICIEAFIQKEPLSGNAPVQVIMLTDDQVKEKDMNAAIEAIEALPSTQGNVVRIRKENLS